MQEIINKISNLSLNTTEEEIYESLSELKSAVLQNGDLSKSILSNANVLESFENYANDSDQNAQLVCEIVEISLTHLPLQDPASFNVIEQLVAASSRFTRLAVRKLQRDCEKISECAPKSTVLLVVECLKSPQFQIGSPSIELVHNFLSCQPELLDDSDIKRELDSCAEAANSEIKCRVFDVGVRVATNSFSSFEKVRFILDRIARELELNDADVLLQMNLLEILQALCTQDYGLNYLEEKGILQRLARRIEQISSDPLTTLLIPSLMKFFGSLAAIFPQKIYTNYSLLVDMLFECLLNEEDTSLTYVALDTLGNLCKYNEGKRTMDATFGERIRQVLSNIYRNISNYPSEIKTRALQCLESVIDVNDGNNQIAYICQKWIESIFSTTGFATLLTYCSMPFEDISLNAFGFLGALVKHQIGQKLVASTGGFIEFLLVRKNGATLEVKQKQFEVIQILSASNQFNATQITQLNRYVREGVNFVEPMSQIDFESS